MGQKVRKLGENISGDTPDKKLKNKSKTISNKASRSHGRNKRVDKILKNESKIR